MTTLFCIICGVSITFFVAFFVGCSRCSVQRNRKAIHVHKISTPETQFADALGGRRFFAHLEQQMSEFLSTHHRAVVILVLSLLIFPLVANAQSEGGPSENGQMSSGSDQSIPPAVAKQLEAMQKKIDQL